MRRLLLLHSLVEGNLKNLIWNYVNYIKKMLTIKPVEIYVELNKFFTTKVVSYKNMELVIKDCLPKLKSDRTYGLVKICIKNFWENKVCAFLKNYSRISLTKVSTSLEMDMGYLLSIIKSCAFVLYFNLGK
jgi:hypothetical protein